MSSKWTLSHLLLLFGPLFIIVVVAEQIDQNELQRQMSDFFRNSRSEIERIQGTVQDLDDETNHRQKRACQYLVGTNSHFCPVADIGRVERGLDGGFNEEKLTTKVDPDNFKSSQKLSDDEVISLLSNLARRRKDLNKIRTLLKDADDILLQHSKRTCRVELGGTCRTEWASAVADQFYYLMSPHSPGKRKRRSSIKSLKTKLSEIIKTKSKN